LGVPIFAQKGRTPGIAFLIASLITIVPITSAPKLLATATAGPITSGAIFNLDANDVNSISGSSTTWKDLTGNGYDATLSASGSGYSISNDVTNKAISFSNGTIRSQNTGASATIGQAIPSQTWTGFSASFSANMGVGGTPIGGINDWSRVFDFSASGFTQGNGAKGGIFISRYERTNDLWLSFMNMATSVFGECAATGIISNEAFAHYAVTVSSNGTCIWYKNGTAWRNYRSSGLGVQTNVNNGSTGPNQLLPTNDAKTSLRIGRSHWNDIYLTGSIRNLAIYNATLTSAQVTTNYNGQTAAYISDVKPTLASASITGTARVGTQLTAVPGAITGSNTTTSYQWLRADTSGGSYSNIASATSSTYTPVSGDAGKYIQVLITVTNTGGSASATSAATGQIASGVTLTTPSAPIVSATSDTLKSISVTWSAIANASSYVLKLYSALGTLLSTTGLTGLSGTGKTITTSNFASMADSTAYKVSITAIGDGASYLDSIESTKSDVTTSARLIRSATLSLDPGELIFRQAKELRATSSVAGKVTFTANGKVIPGCKNRAVSASATVACAYRPSTRGSVAISVTLEPTDNSYIGATSSANSVVINRSGRRGG
jgi:hypothetical protein